ncbi:MAG TPA: SGNH/GDSL hydrolase family protein [Egibacteraceae bacterium]
MSRRRLAAAAALASPAALAAVVAAQVRSLVRGEFLDDPAFSVAAECEPPAPTDRLLRLAVLGDSTVAGIGADEADGSLPVLVAERVARLAGCRVAVTGHGRSGARTADVRGEQVPVLADGDVDVALVVVGSNDVTHVTPPWRLAAETAALVREAAARAGAVVLGGIPEFATVPRFPQPLRAVAGAWADLLRAVQRRSALAAGALFVDIAALASPRFLGRPETMSADGYHPSAIGYGLWADALAPAVAALAGPRAAQ